MGGVFVWFAGAQLSDYGDAISRRTGLGQAFVGGLLLATATSLPEIATTASASAAGDVALAVNNLLGGISMQTAVLAVVDMIAVRGALTFFAPRPVLILQAALLIGLLGVSVAATAAGEVVSLANIGLWPVILATAYVLALYQTKGYRQRTRWRTQGPSEEAEAMQRHEEEEELRTRQQEQKRFRQSTRRLIGMFIVFSIVVLIAGIVVARTGGALADQTGLGQTFVGATLVALATSLPELSAAIRAVQIGAYGMAVSNIFGSNSLLIGLFLLAEIAHRDGLIIEAVDESALFSAGLGIALTTIYIWGLLERRDAVVLRMGIDSALVLTTYLGGLVVLYNLRP